MKHVRLGGTLDVLNMFEGGVALSGGGGSVAQSRSVETK